MSDDSDTEEDASNTLLDGNPDDDIILELPPPPDGGWAWVILACSFTIHIVVRGTFACFGVFFDSFTEYFNEPRAKIALASSLQNGVGQLIGPVVSGLTNRFGCRPVIIAGSFISFAGLFLSIFSPTANVLILNYTVIGIGFGLIFLPAVVSVSYYFEKRRGMASCIVTCGSGIGAIIFAPLTRLLLDYYGWQGANLIISAIMLNCLIFGALNRPLKAVQVPNEENQELFTQLAERRGTCVSIDSECLAQQLVLSLNRQSTKRNEPADEVIPPLGTPKVKFAPPPLKTIDEDNASSSEKEDAEEDKKQRRKSSIPYIDVEQEGNKTESLDASTETDKHGEKQSLVPHQTASAPSSSPRKDSPIFIPKQVVHRVRSQPMKPREIHHFKSRRRKTTPTRMPDSEANIDARRPTLVLPLNYQASVYSIRRRASAFPLPASEDSLCMSLPNNDIVRKSLRRGHMISPLSRKDTFYMGSVKKLKQQHSLRSTVPYREDVVKFNPLITEDVTKKGSTIACPHWACICLNASCWDVMSDMVDMTLLKNPKFLLLALANVLAMMGFFIPTTYVVDAAVLKGVDRTIAVFLLSTLGISTIIGRLLSGFVASIPSVNPVWVFNVTLIFAGVSLGCVSFANTYLMFCIICAVYGFISSAFIALTSVVLVDAVGLEKLTSAFGLISLFRGLACMIGPPIAGAVFDWSGSYYYSFLFGGAMLLLAGLTGFIQPIRDRCTS